MAAQPPQRRAPTPGPGRWVEPPTIGIPTAGIPTAGIRTVPIRTVPTVAPVSNELVGSGSGRQRAGRARAGRAGEGPDRRRRHRAVAARAWTPARTPPRAAQAGRPGLGRALLAAAAATALPGLGHLLLRRRAGVLILGGFLILVGAAVIVAVTLGRVGLLTYALDTRALWGITLGCVLLALGWIAVIVRTYLIARPRRVGTGRRVLGATTVAALCVLVAAPLGFAAGLAQSQRTLVNSLFPTSTAGPAGPDGAGVALPARVNVLLFGSDAGSDRTGTRSDSMMVASIDTASGRAVIFGLPRNIERAPFPPGSAMAAKFPHGFFDPRHPCRGSTCSTPSTPTPPATPSSPRPVPPPTPG